MDMTSSSYCRLQTSFPNCPWKRIASSLQLLGDSGNNLALKTFDPRNDECHM